MLSRTKLVTPDTDPSAFTDHLSQAWGVLTGASAAQYLAWSAGAGIFSALSDEKPRTLSALRAATTLSEAGADALLPILVALGLIVEDRGDYALTRLAEEYFLQDSPYYVGAGLYWGCDLPIPPAYLRATETAPPNGSRGFVPPDAFGILKIQLSRNLAPGVHAARCGRLKGIRHLVDIGGGAGSIAIPFAMDNPASRVTLVDLPDKLDAIGEIIRSYGLNDQIELHAMDVFSSPWKFPDCDGVLFGNFFHAFDDARCRVLCEKSFDCLEPGGRVWLHELLFDEGRRGPLLAALWNANMRVIGGRQRMASELIAMLREAGFSRFQKTSTAGRFTLLEGSKGSVRAPETVIR